MVLFDALVAGHVRRRGLRSLVSVFAVSLGVAMWVALRLADAHAVASFSAQSGVFGDEADGAVMPNVGTLAGGLLSRIRAARGVVSATPAREGEASIAGEMVHVSGRDLLAPLPRTQEFRSVLPGPFAPIGSGPDPAALLDRGGAFFSGTFVRAHRLRIGDRVTADGGFGRTSLLVSAIVPRTAILEPNVVIVDLATAARLFGGGDRLDRIDVVARAGARADALAAVTAVVPPGAVVVSAGERRAGVERMAGGFSFDLALLGSLALLAAIVLASDSVAISVVQRRAEIGTLRVLGATRVAIARTFLIEGVLLGTAGGMFGTVAGLALGDVGGTVAAATGAADANVPFLGVLAGIVLGTFGALPAAIAAASLPPDRALRARPSALRGLRTSRGPLARATRAIAGRLADAPPPLALALANLRSAPRRIALGVAALTFGVALATAALVLAASFGVGIVTWAASAFRGDLRVTPVVNANARARFSPDAVARVARLADVASVRATRTIDVPFGGVRTRVANDAPARSSNDGSRPPADASAIDVTIDSTLATRAGLRVGRTFALPVPEGTRVARVARVVDASPFAVASIALAPRAFARVYRDDTADTLDVALRPAADDARATRRIRTILGPRVVDVRVTRDLRARLVARFAPIVAETVAIATLALALGALAILTTLAALALERRDDIRLLRIVGVTHAGIRATIVCEAALLGAFGGCAGIVLGLALAATALAVDRVAFGWAIVLVIPVARLALVLVASVGLAALAGLAPARIASRLVPRRVVRTALAAIALLATGSTAFGSSPHGARTRDGVVRERASDVWRVLGHLRAADGSRFDVAATFFRYELGRRGALAFDAAALSIVDESARRTTTGVRVEREGGGLARESVAQTIDLRVDDWSLRAGRDARVRLRVSSGDVAFDGDMTPLSRPVALAPDVRESTGSCATCLGAGFASTRLATRGVLVVDARRIPVAGSFWIDREREIARGDGRAGPSWRFTLQLDDGRVAFFRAVRGRVGDESASGFVVANDGTVTYLTSARDIVLSNAVATSWRNPSGVAYPSLFEAIVPRLGLDFALVPVVQAQEIDGDGRGLPFYDGALDVERAHPGPRDRGAGYVELTGYAGSIRPSP